LRLWRGVKIVKDQSKKQLGNASKKEDFDAELLGNEVEITLQGGGVLRGRVVSSSRYWLEIEFNGWPVYVNKPYVMIVKPLREMGRKNAGVTQHNAVQYSKA